MLTYRTEQFITNSSMSEQDQESIQLIHDARNELTKLLMIEVDDKNFFHAMGLQGFKRMHRYHAREWLEMIMELEALLIDHYGIEPQFHDVKFEKNQKKSVGERFDCYAKRLEECLGKMNTVKTKLVLNNHHFAACKIQDIIDDLECGLKYAYRNINYCKDVSGDLCDLHWYSHEVHEKYKEKEKEDHNRDIN